DPLWRGGRRTARSGMDIQALPAFPDLGRLGTLVLHLVGIMVSVVIVPGWRDLSCLGLLNRWCEPMRNRRNAHRSCPVPGRLIIVDRGGPAGISCPVRRTVTNQG